MRKTSSKREVDAISYQVIGAAIEVHRILGPGLIESNYEAALLHELNLRGLRTQAQQRVPVTYKDILLDCELRYDVLVEDLVVVENKATHQMNPVFDAVLLSYMKHLQVPKGILINFHVKNLFYEGQRTFVNEYYAALPNN